ncbi:LysR family transcriptional regulator [Solimicrobium silvestre]|uniref:Transcriptional regulator n=1 Tax=Solimicrobium silvestre TaxID=2099400 RepID=A0A2S9H4M4_9BURK|nr:LysR family transcriptional regulator [Solimicrobium silvestre]PRC94917.1 Transcriptional regulator [Solimicrobium silvestre]
MINPQHLAIFVSIVQAGSISGAATLLGCGKSVVSRQLAKLEDDLGARLIQRSTRRLALTEIGEMVLAEARKIEHSLNNIDLITDQFQQQVRGLLRVSCSMAGRRQVVPLIAEFTRLYPQVKVALQLEDHLVDLIKEQIDVAIRVSHLPDSTLVARKLAENPRMLVASPAYLAQSGTPQTPAQLTEHACLVYANEGRVYDEWTFSGQPEPFKVKVGGAIQINDGGALVTAACCGAGILLIPRKIVAEELANGELVEVLENWPLPAGAPIYAVYPARDWLALKTSAFVGFMQERMSA